MGGDGCVDVIYEEPASGGTYFAEHLPLVGMSCVTSFKFFADVILVANLPHA